MRRISFTAILLILLLTAVIRAQDGEYTDIKNEVKPGALPPQEIYAQYVEAVHSGNINQIKSLVYGRNRDLWDRAPKKMLSMTRNIVPHNPILISMKEEHQYQYLYTVMKYSGLSPLNKSRITGEIRMILENGEWRVYMEIWKPQ